MIMRFNRKQEARLTRQLNPFALERRIITQSDSPLDRKRFVSSCSNINGMSSNDFQNMEVLRKPQKGRIV